MTGRAARQRRSATSPRRKTSGSSASPSLSPSAALSVAVVLAMDAIIGPRTFAALTMPRSKHVLQLRGMGSESAATLHECFTRRFAGRVLKKAVSLRVTMAARPTPKHISPDLYRSLQKSNSILMNCAIHLPVLWREYSARAYIAVDELPGGFLAIRHISAARLAQITPCSY